MLTHVWGTGSAVALGPCSCFIVSAALVWVRGTRLHRVRLARGLRLVDVTVPGLSAASLSRIERSARYRMPLTRVVVIARRLGVEVDDAVTEPTWGRHVINLGWALMIQSRVTDALLAARLWDAVIAPSVSAGLALEAELLQAWAEANSGLDTSAEAFRQLASNAQQTGIPGLSMKAALYEGMILDRAGDVPNAIELLSSVSGRARAQGYYDIAATASGAIGQIWLRLGDIERGLEATSIDLPDLQPFPKAYLATARGTLLERHGQLDEAEATLLAATEAAAEVPNPVLGAEAQEALGRLYATRGDLIKADSALLMAIALYTHAGRTAEAMKLLAAAIRRITGAGLMLPAPRLSPEASG
ncbi:MAG TPA: helix-turn-helix transcriptional regulator [bacterium]|nr:helix-turn-helix transcriptional regulator [bacterium]